VSDGHEDGGKKAGTGVECGWWPNGAPGSSLPLPPDWPAADDAAGQPHLGHHLHVSAGGSNG